MKADQSHIENLRVKFTSLSTKEDLIDLMLAAQIILYGEDSKPFALKALNYYANPSICAKRYTSFEIKKKSGGVRIIHSPIDGLKNILTALNFAIQCLHVPSKYSMGFEIDRSIETNAKKHVEKKHVLNIDLKDFFHSFDRNRVKLAFMYPPFNLNGDKEPIAFLLASLCTHPFKIDGVEKSVLPQGSPTSPTLTNIMCQKLDRRLGGLAKRFGVDYTRYADDITFSANHSVLNKKEFLDEMVRIIETDQNLKINQKKTRLQKAGYRKEVTGLIVNDKVNVKRRYVKQIRMWIYYCEKYGYEKAEQIFRRDYLADKGNVKNMSAQLVNVLDGKLEFMKMVKGPEDSTYLTLKERYDNVFSNNNPITQVINDWENKGIEEAMNRYYGMKIQ